MSVDQDISITTLLSYVSNAQFVCQMAYAGVQLCIRRMVNE